MNVMQLQTASFAGTLNNVAKLALLLEGQGFKVLDVYEKRDWPWFWRKKMYVTMAKSAEPIIENTSLAGRLQQALESENYEEAARIRDLMNKK